MHFSEDDRALVKNLHEAY